MFCRKISLSAVVIVLVCGMFTACSDDTSENGKSLVESVKALQESPSKGQIVHTYYNQSEVSEFKSSGALNLPPLRSGALTVDKYELLVNTHAESKYGRHYDIYLVHYVGQINPQDPGFGGVSITEGYYLSGQQSLANWYEIDKNSVDSLQVLLNRND